jgi:hypothetical protein
MTRSAADASLKTALKIRRVMDAIAPNYFAPTHQSSEDFQPIVTIVCWMAALFLSST